MRHIFGTQSIFRGYLTLPASCIIFLPITKFHLPLAFLCKYCQKIFHQTFFLYLIHFLRYVIFYLLLRRLSPNLDFFFTSDIPPQLLPRLPVVKVFLLGLLPLLPFAIFSCQFPYFPATFHIPLDLTLFLSIALSSYSFATFRYTSYLESI